jgi:hypothetical protein
MSAADTSAINGENGAAAPQSQPTLSRVVSGFSHARETIDKKRIVLQKRAKRQYRKIGRKLRKRKQTVIQWLGTGVAHYYMKFLGLWKPETSMGIISDVTRLQDEQQRVMSNLAFKADLHRNEPNPAPTKISDRMKDNPE